MTDLDLQRPIYPDLAGKVALVTGSSRGIGAETARRLSDNKVKVVINGRRAEAVKRVVADINAMGGVAIGCIADCSKTDQVEEMRQQIEDQLGTVNLLFAFAGGDGAPESIEQLTEDRWDAIMAGNRKSKFFTAKTFLPGMKRRGGGSIVLMCSAAGRLPSKASLAYSSAQAGVAMLTRNLAQELGNAGIRVNAVAPSTVMNDKIRAHMESARQQSLAASYAVPRLGEPADVAAAALFLSSSASSWTTGVVLDVAGGKVMI